MINATHRKAYEKAADMRERALDLATQNVYANRAPVGLHVLSNEEILSQAFRCGERVSRSSFYRLWPTRGDLLQSVVGRLLDDDPYATDTIRESMSGVTVGALGRVATGKPEGGIATARPEVIAGLGRVLIEGSNHIIASRVEAAVLSNPELTGLSGKLAGTRERYITTVEGSLTEAHTLLGDVPTSDGAYRDYAENAAALARGIALNPSPAVQDHHDLHSMQFQALAQYFTQ